jgi:lauroyl/myristoyl acyltransferase
MTALAARAARLAQSLRFDGLWWRQFAYLGSVYAPEWFKRYSPPAIAAIIFVLAGDGRRGAIANMQRVLGHRSRWRATLASLRMFSEFAHCMTETMEYYGPRPRPIRLEVPGRDAVADALIADQGAVVVTGHFGNWDIAAKKLCEYGRPVNLVMAREANATTRNYFREVRDRIGVRVIYSDTSVFSSLSMIRALRHNEIVALQLDRMLDTRGARRLPFFGQPAPFPAGPFVLARLSGAPLIPVFIPRLGTRHYAIRVGGRFTLPRESRDGRALEQVMARVVHVFEAMIREHPTQWFQFAPFWPPVQAASPATATDDHERAAAVRRKSG